MPWIYLLLAAACEMIWPLGFKYSDGFTNWSRNWPVIGGTFAVMLASFGFMSLATRGGLPVGTVYAVWTGIGTTGIVLIGMFVLGEPKEVKRLVCLAMIIVGVVGLKLLDKGEPPRAGDVPAAPATLDA
jgi:quaternary ammonium compound-resistance protein SugE